MGKFIGYTVGLECNGHGKVGKMLKVEFERNEDGSVRLTAVSGHNLSSLGVSKTISDEVFQNRPYNDNIAEARWALGRLGFDLMSDDFADK